MSLFFIFLENQLLVPLILYNVYWSLFYIALIFIIFFLLLTLGSLPSFSSTLRYNIRLFIWNFFLFWYRYLLLQTPFVALLLLHFISFVMCVSIFICLKIYFNFPFIFFVDPVLFRSMFLNLPTFINFLKFLHQKLI